jgi:hypothetical protein
MSITETDVVEARIAIGFLRSLAAAIQSGRSGYVGDHEVRCPQLPPDNAVNLMEIADLLDRLAPWPGPETKPSDGGPGYATMGEYCEAHARAKEQSREFMGIQE